MQKLASNMTEASTLMSNIQSVAKSLQPSGMRRSVSKPLQGKGGLGVGGMDIVTWEQWYEINVFLPCISEVPQPFTTSSYPRVLNQCKHQVVLVMPSESVVGLKIASLPDPASLPTQASGSGSSPTAESTVLESVWSNLASDPSNNAKATPNNGALVFRTDLEEMESVGK